jgi:hypothetical protein
MLPPDFIGPYIGSNIFAIVLLLIAVWRPTILRVVFAIIFITASLFNAYTALTEPEAYLMYAELGALPAYQSFINGIFSVHTAAFVLAIATGQFLVGLLLLIKFRTALVLGTLGGIVFLAAIAPLGYGSAFPFSLFAIAALLIMLRKLLQQPA